jgi:hypothetical protein
MGKGFVGWLRTLTAGKRKWWPYTFDLPEQAALAGYVQMPLDIGKWSPYSYDLTEAGARAKLQRHRAASRHGKIVSHVVLPDGVEPVGAWDDYPAAA